MEKVNLLASGLKGDLHATRAFKEKGMPGLIRHIEGYACSFVQLTDSEKRMVAKKVIAHALRVNEDWIRS